MKRVREKPDLRAFVPRCLRAYRSRHLPIKPLADPPQPLAAAPTGFMRNRSSIVMRRLPGMRASAETMLPRIVPRRLVMSSGAVSSCPTF